MFIQNIRLGFATNSSSSHSIILNSKLKGVNDNYYHGDFGWDYFTLATKEAKEEYFSVMIMGNFRHMLGESFTIEILKGMNLPVPKRDAYIDHQSLISFPKKVCTDLIDYEFVSDFREFMCRNDVFILGGNDNESIGHPLFEADELHQVMQLQESSYMSRKDGDWWTLYDNRSGNRITFSFKDNPEKFEPMPMLVDMKITDFCDRGCSFCYMDSTPEGKHSDKVDSYIHGLRSMDVFEVALGGGEPTKHPRFIEILSWCKYNNIKPNFSTKSLDWIKNDDYKNILDLCGSFGYSVSSIDEMITLRNLIKYKNDHILNEKIVLQIIPAIFKPEELYDILVEYKKVGYNVLFLGYKNTGRGKDSFNLYNEREWLNVVKKLFESGNFLSVSIDTTLANRYNDIIKGEDIDERFYHIKDGKYSCYIDAVNKKIGPSSYEPDKFIDCGPYELKENMPIIGGYYVQI